MRRGECLACPDSILILVTRGMALVLEMLLSPTRKAMSIHTTNVPHSILLAHPLLNEMLLFLHNFAH